MSTFSSPPLVVCILMSLFYCCLSYFHLSFYFSTLTFGFLYMSIFLGKFFIHHLSYHNLPAHPREYCCSSFSAFFSLFASRCHSPWVSPVLCSLPLWLVGSQDFVSSDLFSVIYFIFFATLSPSCFRVQILHPAFFHYIC